MSIHEILEEFESYPSSFAADAQDGRNVMDEGIRPLLQGVHVAGSAVTVDCPPGDQYALFVALEKHVKPGDVIVIDAKGNRDLAMMGGIFARICTAKGVKGMVVDGVVRDVEDYRTLQFPVFARGVIPRSSISIVPGQINTPVTCGGVTVKPGDIVVGDDDGVVVVPKDRVMDVLQKVRKVAENEKKWVEILSKGTDEFFEMEKIAQKTALEKLAQEREAGLGTTSPKEVG